jgi:serine/threonine protein kinase
MGVVYRAEHVMLGRQDAVKLLAAELSADAAFRERFLRESRIAAGMDHPNVIPIHHAGEVDGLLYLAMRYVKGSDLRTALDQRGQLGLDETLAIAEQVGSALDAAHERGLVHRDVKPANILISEAGRVYLTDFGIAKHTRTRGGLTKPGSFLGTLDYAAPEQIEAKDVDGRADQYALGCVLYHCLAGWTPYEKDSDVQLIYAHLLERAPPVTSRRPGLPPAVDLVLERALAKNRDARYATCSELAQALQDALGAAADEAPPPARSAPTRAVRRPLPEPASAAGVAPLPPLEPSRDAAAPPFSAPPEARPAPPPPPTESPPAAPPQAPPSPILPARVGRSRRRLPLFVGLGVLVAAGVGVAIALALGGGSNKSEKDLLALVPSSIRSSCVSLGAKRAADAAVTCTAGAQSVAYYAFPSSSGLDSDYTSQLPSGVARNRGSCAGLPRVGERSYRSGGKVAGRVFCDLDAGGGAEIGWTNDRTHLAGRASRADGDQAALYRWWSSSAGPLSKAGAKTAPTLTVPLPAGAVLYSATLANASKGWRAVQVKNVMRTSYSGGGYQAVLQRPRKAALPSTALLDPPLSFGSARVQVDATPVARAGGYSFGVTCRSGSSGHYRLEVRNDGEFLIVKSAGSKTTVLSHKAYGRRLLGTTNRIRGACIGQGKTVRLSVTLKGRTLAVTDRRAIAASGAAGVVAESQTKGGVKIRFANFVVRNS